jgi:hypothetical protein
MKVVLSLRGGSVDIERTFEMSMPPRPGELFVFSPWQLYVTPTPALPLRFQVSTVEYSVNEATDELYANVICHAKAP